MPLRFSSGLVKKMVDTSPVRTLLTGGKILIFPGAQPAAADDAATVTPLITITGITFDSDGTGGILKQTTATDWTGTISADGTAGWFRICESADAGTGASTTLARMDGAIATSGGQMNLVNLSFVNGAPFTITDAQITFPKE
jgi:hypothetical protein